MEYKIAIKPASVKRNQVTAIHLIAAILLIVIGALALIAPFAINIFNAGKNMPIQKNSIANYSGILFIIIGFAIVIITIFFNKKWIKDKKNSIIRIVELICFGSIVFYSLIHLWYIPAIYAGIAFISIWVSYYMEKISTKERYFIINEKGVQLKSPLKSTEWNWTQLEKFFVKHNVVTLVDTNQKLFQFIIIKNQTLDINNINTYSATEIEKAIPNRLKDNW